MTHSELKYELSKVIELVPDNVLADVLEYLKQVQNSPIEKIELSRNLKKVLLEDRELLERLAR